MYFCDPICLIVYYISTEGVVISQPNQKHVFLINALIFVPNHGTRKTKLINMLLYMVFHF